MEQVLATCRNCKAEQNVTAEAKKAQAALSGNTFGAYPWKCSKCGTVNQGTVAAEL
jgi:uncharacterized Zn finger protein